MPYEGSVAHPRCSIFDTDPLCLSPLATTAAIRSESLLEAVTTGLIFYFFLNHRHIPFRLHSLTNFFVCLATREVEALEIVNRQSKPRPSTDSVRELVAQQIAVVLSMKVYLKKIK